MIEKEKQNINPGPDYVIPAEAILVVAGERQNIKRMKENLMNN
ncbi:hypothetical protein PRECH8_11140 [Insulibacter thermoxylanivorax]|uniref:TrkA-C domain-containing protein n=1 Tax=Insulibacter thermoxylanivorax TaxID=2749268 RepID=A0A916QEX9_9BACL|nr:hypothetical protein [Insulibacter thermoxylanivorax]GFR37818.1 hypothetical protein PRECH8_11140 [Insulibacter thermoxylanivorax]